ncbi:MAG: hypothetical protein ACKER6_00935 [Candidatus Hodgkinia cicadicola]
MTRASIDSSPSMTDLLRPTFGFVCIVAGVFVCANSVWASLKHLWRPNKPSVGRMESAASHPSLARKMAAAHAAIGYLKSEVLADAAVSRELDRLMRHNGSVVPKLTLTDPIAKPKTTAEAGSAIDKAGKAVNATKTNQAPKRVKKSEQNHHSSRRRGQARSLESPKRC